MSSLLHWRRLAGSDVPVLLMARELGVGGSERQLAAVAMHLQPFGFAAHVGCFHSNGFRADELRAAGVPVVEFPIRSLYTPAALRHIASAVGYVRRHGIQLVHTFDYPTTGIMLPAIRYATRALVVSSQRAHRCLIPSPYIHLQRATDRFVDGIVANCDYIRTHLIADYGIAAARIHVCYNGLDASVFDPDGPTVRGTKVDADKVTIGVVCVQRPEKDLATLVDAFARLPYRERNLSLVLVGSGPEQPGLKRRAQELGITDFCIWQDAVGDVAPWLRAIDIFVLPSRSEALSNSLMEAMAAGCCPVASRVGGNPELVGQDRGALFEPGSAQSLAKVLMRLAEDPARRAKLAENARRFVAERLDIRESAKTMAGIYKELLSDGRR